MPFANNYSFVLLCRKQFPTVFHMHAPSLLQYYPEDTSEQMYQRIFFLTVLQSNKWHTEWNFLAFVEKPKFISFSEHCERSLAQIKIYATRARKVGNVKRAGALKSNAFNVHPTGVNTIGPMAVLNVIILFIYTEFTIVHLHKVSTRFFKAAEKNSCTNCQKIARGSTSNESSLTHKCCVCCAILRNSNFFMFTRIENVSNILKCWYIFLSIVDFSKPRSHAYANIK